MEARPSQYYFCYRGQSDRKMNSTWKLASVNYFVHDLLSGKFNFHSVSNGAAVYIRDRHNMLVGNETFLFYSDGCWYLMNGYDKKFEMRNEPTSATLRIKSEGWCQPFEFRKWIFFSFSETNPLLLPTNWEVASSGGTAWSMKGTVKTFSNQDDYFKFPG